MDDQRRKVPLLSSLTNLTDFVSIMFDMKDLAERDIPSIAYQYVDEYMSLPNSVNHYPCLNPVLTRYAFIKYIDRIDKKTWLDNMVCLEMQPDHVDMIMELVTGCPSRSPSIATSNMDLSVFGPVPFDSTTISGTACSRLHSRIRSDFHNRIWKNPCYVDMLLRLLNQNTVATIMSCYINQWLCPELQPVTLAALRLGWSPDQHMLMIRNEFGLDELDLLVGMDIEDLEEWKQAIRFGLSLGIPINHENRGADVLFENIYDENRIEFLVNLGADTESRDRHGHTPLLAMLKRNYRAQRLPSEKTVRSLLFPNPDVLDMSNSHGESALNYYVKSVAHVTQVLGQTLSVPDYSMHTQWIDTLSRILGPLLHTNQHLAEELVMPLPSELHDLVVGFSLPRFDEEQALGTMRNRPVRRTPVAQHSVSALPALPAFSAFAGFRSLSGRSTPGTIKGQVAPKSPRAVHTT